MAHKGQCSLYSPYVNLVSNTVCPTCIKMIGARRISELQLQARGSKLSSDKIFSNNDACTNAQGR